MAGSINLTHSLLWRLECIDGTILRHSGHDRDVKIDEDTYFASQALEPSEYASSLGLEGGEGEYLGAIDHDLIKSEMFENRKFDGAKLYQIQYDWSQDAVLEEKFMGYVVGVFHDQTRYRLEVSQLHPNLNKPGGRSFAVDCQAQLGDTACGIDCDALGFFHDAIVEKGGRDWIQFARCDAPPSAFTDGIAAFENYKDRFPIAVDSEFGGVRRVEFLRSVTHQIEVNAKVRLYWGCNRTLQHCAARFDNIVNFRGFPHLPKSLSIIDA